MKSRFKIVWLVAMSFFAWHFAAAAENAASPAVAAQAINSLGLDLLKETNPGANALLSPYSIQSALAMTFAGAAGGTRSEMARVLHYPGDEAELHRSFAALRQWLDQAQKSAAQRAEKFSQGGGSNEPVALTVADRLFGQKDYDFRQPFLALLKDTYDSPFQPMDFINNAAGARQQINDWVAEQTRQRIRDLIPPDGLDRKTRLVLVNAIYLKAPWTEPFAELVTRPSPFHVNGGAAVDAPTMVRRGRFGYARQEGFSVVTIPYLGGDVQFLILLPDETNGLAALETKVTPQLLAASARPNTTDLILHLPKFKLQPPLFRLSQMLQSLGMKFAFDKPRGSANFDRMAPRRPDDYLYLSEVFHKTFLALDEKGTEAAAATAAVMARPTAVIREIPQPIEVRVDHPFLFAIQHRPSGACLFLGRVVDPR